MHKYDEAKIQSHGIDLWGLFIKYFLWASLALALLLFTACASKSSSEQAYHGSMGSSPIIGKSGPTVAYRGKNVSTVHSTDFKPHVLVNDGQGGLALIESTDVSKPDPAYMDARELKLKIRELAEQLVADSTDSYLRTAIAMPVSFVRVDNMDKTSSFGRLVAEQLIYEFNQRGFPVKEYRIDNAINAGPNNGEYYLKRTLGKVSTSHPGALVIAGTYHADPKAVFVNARLIRPSDGRVLKTGNLVLANNKLTQRLLASGIDLNNSGMNLKSSGMEIKQARTSSKAGSSAGNFGDGLGIH